MTCSYFRHPYICMFLITTKYQHFKIIFAAFVKYNLKLRQVNWIVLYTSILFSSNYKLNNFYFILFYFSSLTSDIPDFSIFQFRSSKQLSYQAMSSTQSQLCTATSISSFVQCYISFQLLSSSVATFILIESFLR